MHIFCKFSLVSGSIKTTLHELPSEKLNFIKISRDKLNFLQVVKSEFVVVIINQRNFELPQFYMDNRNSFRVLGIPLPVFKVIKNQFKNSA